MKITDLSITGGLGKEEMNRDESTTVTQMKAEVVEDEMVRAEGKNVIGATRQPRRGENMALILRKRNGKEHTAMLTETTSTIITVTGIDLETATDIKGMIFATVGSVRWSVDHCSFCCRQYLIVVAQWSVYLHSNGRYTCICQLFAKCLFYSVNATS